jgi:dTDP-glucose pyrophosphorylase
MNILALMAGGSEAFAEAGYTFPKNLVEIGGKPLVQRVLENLLPQLPADGRLVTVLRHDEVLRFHTASVVNLLAPGAVIVETPGPTAGAACTALLAIEHLNDDTPLLIANGDQLFDCGLAAALADFRARSLDGGIVVFDDVHPRWSFVKVDADGRAVETAEKRPISRLATAGLYYFAHGSDFVRAATGMIKKGADVNGLYYVCPAYNELILEQKNIGVHEIPKAAYRSLATPQGVAAYDEYLREQSKRV